MEPYELPTLNISNCVTIKLNERNYILWKNQFKTFLSGQGLLGFIDGSTRAPSRLLQLTNINGKVNDVPNPDFPSWTRSDQVVKSWLLGSFSEDILSLVVSATTSYEVWTTLSRHFNRISSARLFELQRRLQTTSKENKSTVDYLTEIKTVCDQLSSIGSPVDERMKIFAALHGLGREYEPIKTSIEGSMDAVPCPSFEDIAPRLTSFDSRIQSYQLESSVTPHLAFNVSRSNYYDNNQKGRGNGYTRFGSYRGRGSFLTKGRGFPQQFSGSNNNDAGDNKPQCQIYRRFGHNALRCWHRFDNGYQADDMPTALSAMHITESTEKASGGEWFPDSGASAHVTNNTKRLQHSQPYYGTDTVMVGEGNYLPITHIGSTNFASSSGMLSLKSVLVCPDITKLLLSVSQLTTNYPCSVIFDCDGVEIKDKETRTVLIKGRRQHDLYILDDPKAQLFFSSRQQTASDEVWHWRLGHPNDKVLQHLSQVKAISINKLTKRICESCQLGKNSHLSFSTSSYSASQPLE